MVLRPRVLPFVAAEGGDSALVAEAKKLASGLLRTRVGAQPDLTYPLLRVAATRADRAWFDRLVGQAKKTTDANYRQTILWSLGDLRDPALASDALDLLLGDSLDPRDTYWILVGLLRSRETRDTAYEWAKAHFDEFFPRLRDDEQSWLLSLPSNFCDMAHRDDAKAFLEPRAAKIDGGPRALARSLEEVDLCVAAQERNRAGIEAFLRKY